MPYKSATQRHATWIRVACVATILFHSRKNIARTVAGLSDCFNVFYANLPSPERISLRGGTRKLLTSTYRQASTSYRPRCALTMKRVASCLFLLLSPTQSSHGGRLRLPNIVSSSYPREECRQGPVSIAVEVKEQMK
jgi:hypothetical protein